MKCVCSIHGLSKNGHYTVIRYLVYKYDVVSNNDCKCKIMFLTIIRKTVKGILTTNKTKLELYIR